VTVTVAPCALPGDAAGRLVTIRDRSAEAAREAELMRQAHRDGLTGLLNHRSFTARLGEEAERLADEADPTPGGGHGRRVADLSVALAARLDWPPTRQARLHRAARVHDAGKALLPAELLGRPAPLTTLEAAHVRQHPALGAALAGAALDPEQARWVRHHHDRWDGAGYPDGPAGTDIPDGARILALADAWDAMTTDRPYRAALRADAALSEVERLSARQFMPGAGALLGDALRWWEAA